MEKRLAENFCMTRAFATPATSGSNGARGHAAPGEAGEARAVRSTAARPVPWSGPRATTAPRRSRRRPRARREASPAARTYTNRATAVSRAPWSDPRVPQRRPARDQRRRRTGAQNAGSDATCAPSIPTARTAATRPAKARGSRQRINAPAPSRPSRSGPRSTTAPRGHAEPGIRARPPGLTFDVL